MVEQSNRNTRKTALATPTGKLGEQSPHNDNRVDGLASCIGANGGGKESSAQTAEFIFDGGGGRPRE